MTASSSTGTGSGAQNRTASSAAFLEPVDAFAFTFKQLLASGFDDDGSKGPLLAGDDHSLAHQFQQCEEGRDHLGAAGRAAKELVEADFPPAGKKASELSDALGHVHLGPGNRNGLGGLVPVEKLLKGPREIGYREPAGGIGVIHSRRLRPEHLGPREKRPAALPPPGQFLRGLFEELVLEKRRGQV